MTAPKFPLNDDYFSIINKRMKTTKRVNRTKSISLFSIYDTEITGDHKSKYMVTELTVLSGTKH